MKAVKVGDTIYLPSALYISHGADDFVGGKATVIEVEMGMSGGEMVPFVRCAENQSTRYNWEYLSQEQEKLKERFGKSRSYKDPDLREEFNRWD